MSKNPYGTRRSTVEERPLIVRWVAGPISRGGPIKLFLIPASAIIKAVICAILSVGMLHIKHSSC